MRIGVVLMSLVNVGVGALLAALVARDRADVFPPIVLAIAVTLAMQGGYTFAYLARAAGRRAPVWTLLLVGGECASLLLGGVAVVAGAGHIAVTLGRDPEFAPMTFGALMSLHALVTLLWVAQDAPEPRPA